MSTDPVYQLSSWRGRSSSWGWGMEGGVGSKQGRQRAKTAARNLSDGHSRAVCSFSSTHEGKRRCQSRRGHPFICLLSRLSLSWLVSSVCRCWRLLGPKKERRPCDPRLSQYLELPPALAQSGSTSEVTRAAFSNLNLSFYRQQTRQQTTRDNERAARIAVTTNYGDSSSQVACAARGPGIES